MIIVSPTPSALSKVGGLSNTSLDKLAAAKYHGVTLVAQHCKPSNRLHAGGGMALDSLQPGPCRKCGEARGGILSSKAPCSCSLLELLASVYLPKEQDEAYEEGLASTALLPSMWRYFYQVAGVRSLLLEQHYSSEGGGREQLRATTHPSLLSLMISRWMGF